MASCRIGAEVRECEDGVSQEQQSELIEDLKVADLVVFLDSVAEEDVDHDERERGLDEDMARDEVREENSTNCQSEATHEKDDKPEKDDLPGPVLLKVHIVNSCSVLLSKYIHIVPDSSVPAVKKKQEGSECHKKGHVAYCYSIREANRIEGSRPVNLVDVEDGKHNDVHETFHKEPD